MPLNAHTAELLDLEKILHINVNACLVEASTGCVIWVNFIGKGLKNRHK